MGGVPGICFWGLWARRPATPIGGQGREGRPRSRGSSPCRSPLKCSLCQKAPGTSPPGGVSLPRVPQAWTFMTAVIPYPVSASGTAGGPGRRSQSTAPFRGGPAAPCAAGGRTGRHVLCRFLVPAGHLSSGCGEQCSLTSVGWQVGTAVVVVLSILLSDLTWLLDTLGYKLMPRGRSGSNPLGIFLEPNLQTLSGHVSQFPTVRTHSALEAKGPGRRFGTTRGRRGWWQRSASSNGAPAPSLARGTRARWLSDSRV